MITQKELKDFVAVIKSKTGLKQFEISKEAGYEPKSLGQLISKGANLQEVYDQLNRIFGERLKNSPFPSPKNVGAGEAPSGTLPDYTPNQIMSLLAESFRDQKEILKIHAKWLESIENKMARQDSQAMIDKKIDDLGSNLKRVVVGVETLSQDSERLQEDMQELFSVAEARKNSSSQGAGKKSHQTDGDGKKPYRKSG